MQAGPWYITVPCLSLEYGRHMKAALRGPAAHYFVFINITLAEAQNRDPWQLRNCRLIHLFQLGQQHKASFTLPHTPNDNGTSTTGMRAAGVRPCCRTPLFRLFPSFITGHGACQEDTLKKVLSTNALHSGSLMYLHEPACHYDSIVMHQFVNDFLIPLKAKRFPAPSLV